MHLQRLSTHVGGPAGNKERSGVGWLSFKLALTVYTMLC
jgi:hypothetical protein